jgi:asparagine synthase (glutamine-hydrolysing)
MCGICGIFEYGTGQLVEGDLLRRMNRTLFHRGPDDEGFLERPGVGLAMRRLSIIDIAGGQQPIANEDETAWVILNGEVYNYQSLRAELLERGHRLSTQSDTEAILHLYEDLDSDCVHQLDGMFAFAVYDARPSTLTASPTGRLLIGRDRLGKKPLYYADVHGTLIFGSELKPLLQDSRISRELDLEALDHYLSLHMIPAPYSIFKAIRKLPAGCVLDCDVSEVKIRRYWNFTDFLGCRRLPEEEAVAEIRRLLFAAVEKRLISEVPLGAFLSGGLDSSTVVAIMAQLKQEPVKTFAIGFEGPATYSELPYARALAAHYKTDHYEAVARPDIVELLPQMVYHADEPFADEAAIPTFLIAQAARDKVTVVLTGDGGDEVFGGYHMYLYEQWARTYRQLPPVTDAVIAELTSVLGRRPGMRLLDQMYRFSRSSRGTVGQRRLGWGATWREEQKQELYSPEVRAAINGNSSADFLDGQVAGIDSPLQKMFGIDTMVVLPDEMLAKVDRMTMAASVEARCPLLDYRLVEFMAGLDPVLKIPGQHNKHLKHLLRQAACDLVPAELLKRPKHGFNVPLNYWFREGARRFVADTLRPEAIRKRGIFNPDAVQALLEQHWLNKVDAGPRIYALLVFEIWASKFLP